MERVELHLDVVLQSLLVTVQAALAVSVRMEELSSKLRGPS